MSNSLLKEHYKQELRRRLNESENLNEGLVGSLIAKGAGKLAGAATRFGSGLVSGLGNRLTSGSTGRSGAIGNAIGRYARNLGSRAANVAGAAINVAAQNSEGPNAQSNFLTRKPTSLIGGLAQRAARYLADRPGAKELLRTGANFSARTNRASTRATSARVAALSPERKAELRARLDANKESSAVRVPTTAAERGRARGAARAIAGRERSQRLGLAGGAAGAAAARVSALSPERKAELRAKLDANKAGSSVRVPTTSAERGRARGAARAIAGRERSEQLNRIGQRLIGKMTTQMGSNTPATLAKGGKTSLYSAAAEVSKARSSIGPISKAEDRRLLGTVNRKLTSAFGRPINLREAYRKPRFGDGIRSRVLAAILGTYAGAMAGHDAQSRTNPVIPPLTSSMAGIYGEAPLTQRTPIVGDRNELFRDSRVSQIRNVAGDMHYFDDAERLIDKHGLEYPRIDRITDRNIKPGVYGALGGAGAYLAALINKLRPHSYNPRYRRMKGDTYLNSGRRKKPDPNKYIPPERSFTPSKRTWSKPVEPGPRYVNISSRGKVYSKPTEPPEGRFRKMPHGGGLSMQGSSSEQPPTSSEVAKSILGDFGMPALPTSSASVPDSWFPKSDSPPTHTTPTINPTVSDEPTSPTPAAGTGSAGQPSTPTETPDKPTEELPGVAGKAKVKDVLKQAEMRRVTGGHGGKGRSGKRPSV